MYRSTVFTLGALFTLATGLIGSANPSSNSYVASLHNTLLSSSTHLGTSVTSTRQPSITTTFTSTESLADDAAALLPTSYLTEFGGAEWNPYGPDPYGFPNNAPASINAYCSSLFESSSSHFLSTVALTSSTVAPYTIIETPFLLTETEGSALTLTVTETAATTELVGGEVYVYNQNRFTFIPSAPCCLNCTLFGGTVQVYYWPTPAPSPPVTKLVNAANFTFTSPSIYVAFQSLHATDLCGPVGQTYNSTTLAFAPGELSTAAEYFIGTPYWYTDANNHSTLTTDTFVPPVENFTQADFGKATSCADITTVSLYNDGLFSFDDAMGGDGTMTVTMTYNLCSPKVSMPTELFTINSMWTACLKGIDGFFDPPYTLTPGNGLSAFSTADPATAASEAQTTSSAAAGSTPAPVTPAQTMADPTMAAPSSTASLDPPASIPSNNRPVPSPTPSTDLPASVPSDNSPALSSTKAHDPLLQPSMNPSVSADPPADPVTTIPASSPFTIASQILSPGSQITHSSTTYSLASNGATLVIVNSQGTSTQILATAALPSPNPSAYVTVGTNTISAGSSAVTISGTTYSLAPSGNALVVDGTSQYLIGSQTLVPGGSAITVSGTVASLLPGGSSVVIAGSTLALSALTGTGPTTISEVEYLIGSQTLSAGGVATISISGSAVQVSLLPGGASVVVGGTTTAPASILISEGAKSTEVLVTETGLGGIIASVGGFVGSTTSASITQSPYVSVPSSSGMSAYNGTTFTGSASLVSRREGNVWVAWWGLVLGFGTIGVVSL